MPSRASAARAPEELERVLDPALRLRSAERVRRDAQVVLDGQAGQEPPSLGNDRDARRRAPARGGGPSGRRSPSMTAPAARAQQARDREHQRRLAGAVRRRAASSPRPGGISSETSRTIGRPAAARPRSPSQRAGRRRRGRAHSSSSVPRYARITCSSRRTSAVGPDAISLPKSSTAVVSQQAGDEAHVVVDEDHERAELLRDPLDHLAEALCLLVGKPGRRLVEQHHAGLPDDGAGDLHEPALARAEPADPGLRRARRARRTSIAASTSARRRGALGARSARGSSPRCRTPTAARSPCSVWNVRRRPQRARR